MQDGPFQSWNASWIIEKSSLMSLVPEIWRIWSISRSMRFSGPFSGAMSEARNSGNFHIVPSGLLTLLADTAVDVVVANEAYTDRIRELVAEARKATSLTGDDAFRLLQLLTRLRGDPIEFGRQRR